MAGILRQLSFLPLAVPGSEAHFVNMFSDNCPTHGRRVLLGPDDITAVHNGPDGVRVHWRCPCGGRGSYLTGRRRAKAAAL